MPGDLQPLVNNQKIVNADGTPTDYFIRWAQQRQIDISGGVPASRTITAGDGLSGGGDLSEDRTIELDASLGDLNDVDMTTPPTNGQVLKYVAADSKWKPGTGGGGGGGGAAAATLVQSAYARVSGGGTQNVTLGVAPTPGNILVAIWNGAGGNGSGGFPAGFSVLGFNMNENPIDVYNGDAKPGGLGGDYQGCWVAARLVQAGDSATVTFNRGGDVNNFGLIEISDADIFDFKIQNLQMAGDNYFVVRQRPPHEALCLVIIESDGNDAPVMAGAGWTLLNAWSGATNHAAAIWEVDDATNALAGAFAGASHPFPVCWQLSIAKYSGS